MKKILVISQLMIAIYSLVSLADDDEEGAKALFYDGDGSSLIRTSATVVSDSPSPPSIRRKTQPIKVHHSNSQNSSITSATQQHAGMKYWIELQRGDKLMRVSPSFPFRSGDRFKVSVMTNRDGYLYLVNVGTTGQVHLLYPPETSNDDGHVKAKTLYQFPLKGMMRFDDNPGEELFKIALSPVPLTGASNAQVSELSTNPANNYNKTSFSNGSSCSGSKDILLDDACEEKGSKDIFVEDDQSGDTSSIDAHPASYAVAPASYLQQGNPILKTLKLKHQ